MNSILTEYDIDEIINKLLHITRYYIKFKIGSLNKLTY